MGKSLDIVERDVAERVRGQGESKRRCAAVYAVRVVAIAASMSLVASASPVVSNVAAASPLTAFLLQPGEMGGFLPGRAQVFRTVAAVRSEFGSKPTGREIKRYESEGLVEAAAVRSHDRAEPAAKGASSVFEFSTPGAATAEMAAEIREALDPDALNTVGGEYIILRRFHVSGVPGGAAFEFVTNASAAELGVESGTGRGMFVDGNCLFAVAVFRPASTEVRALIVTALQAISSRTRDTCV